jgi:hypothetical protein
MAQERSQRRSMAEGFCHAWERHPGVTTRTSHLTEREM